jgi:hypothetical protein
MARQLQVVDTGAVMIDYAVVDPPVEILDPITFVNVVSGDTGLAAIVAESGGTVTDVVVPEEIANYAAVAGVVEPPVQVVENKTPLYVGLAVGLGGVAGLIAAGLLVMKMKKRLAGKPLTRHVEVIELNPAVRVIGGASERQIFVPGQIRV